MRPGLLTPLYYHRQEKPPQRKPILRTMRSHAPGFRPTPTIREAVMSRTPKLRRARIALLLPLALLFSGQGSMAQHAQAQTLLTGGDWPMYGHDPQRTGYSPDETTLSANNISQLEQLWQINVG